MNNVNPDLPPSRSLREIVGDVADDARQLIRGELTLARAELDQKLDRVMAGAITVIGGMLVAFAGLVILLLAIALALAIVLPGWAAALITGAVIIGAGGVVAYSGIKALSIEHLMPWRTVRNVEKDASMVKEHVS